MRGGLVVVALIAGCGSKGHQKRSGDAAAVEVVTGPGLPDGNTAGASSEEIEPNDGEDVATPLALGATVRGKIDPEADADVYRIEVTQPGALAIELTAPDGVDLTLELEDAAGTSLARSDRGGPKIKEGVPNAGVTPGRYLAIVRAKKLPAKAVAPKKLPKGRKGTSAPPAPPAPGDAGPTAVAPVYEITARLQPIPANAEHEPDDDRGTANDLIPGDAVTGYLGWTADADVWKLSVETLSAKNAFDLELSAVEGVALTVELADGVGHTLVTRKGARGAPLVMRGLVAVVPPGASPFHYVTIRGDHSNPETPYQLKVTTTLLGQDPEIEPNDTPDRAQAVPVDRKIVNAMWTPGDVDCYALPAEQAASTVDVTIVPKEDPDLAAELFVDGKSTLKANHGGKGASERITGPVPAGAQAVICVRGTDVSGQSAYELRIGESSP